MPSLLSLEVMEGGKDEVALVTGASGGLGEGIARTLAQKVANFL